MPKAAASKAPEISHEAVQAGTGKNRQQWFAILDKAGCAKMSHQEIVLWLNEHQQPGPWWGQMITVAYEQSRGLRDKHQKPDGYEVSGSRTIAVPIATLFKAWNDRQARHRWLDAELTIRKATANKSLRITWTDGKTSVVVTLIDKGAGKSQVALQHSKLASAKAAAQMKAYWAVALDRLKATLEK